MTHADKSPFRHGPVSRTHTIDGALLAYRKLISEAGLTPASRSGRQNASANEQYSAAPSLVIKYSPYCRSWRTVWRRGRQDAKAATMAEIAELIRATAMAAVTQLLSQVEQGDPSAAEQLLPLVYDELRKLAAANIAKEKPGQTLQATALVHEAYLRLVDVEVTQHWNSRGHFFSAAAEAMRRILVEKARRKQRLKHGGSYKRVVLLDNLVAADDRDDLILFVDESLDALAKENTQAANLVKMRFFAGLPRLEAADALAIAPRTADRLWAYAKAWLHQELQTKR